MKLARALFSIIVLACLVGIECPAPEPGKAVATYVIFNCRDRPVTAVYIGQDHFPDPVDWGRNRIRTPIGAGAGALIDLYGCEDPDDCVRRDISLCANDLGRNFVRVYFGPTDYLQDYIYAQLGIWYFLFCYNGWIDDDEINNRPTTVCYEYDYDRF